jgi:hypothetical protein
MPRLPAAGALALLALAAIALAAPPARGASWSWPVRGRVAVAFRLGADPFAAGQHRGIEIAARAGAPVRAACAGRIAFAGRVAARGPVVSEICGMLTATYLQLGALAVRAGERVRSGDPVGTLPARRGVRLYFGVRRTARRFGYLDPLALLPPRAGLRRRRPAVAERRRVPIVAPLPGPRPAAPPAPRPTARVHVPASQPAPGGALAARLGLLLAGLALPSWGGALVVSRGRARRAARALDLARRAA